MSKPVNIDLSDIKLGRTYRVLRRGRDVSRKLGVSQLVGTGVAVVIMVLTQLANTAFPGLGEMLNPLIAQAVIAVVTLGMTAWAHWATEDRVGPDTRLQSRSGPSRLDRLSRREWESL